MADQEPQLATGAVMIIEDESLVAMFLADLVEDLGWVVIGPVASRAAALRAAANNRPAVAIVDVSLGSESGIGLAQELKFAFGTAVIFLSGHAHVADDQAVQEIGPAAVLQKPCSLRELEAALRDAIG